MSAAKAEVELVGGRIIFQLSPMAFVAELPDTVDPNNLTASTEQPAGPVDYPTQLAIDAWTANNTQGSAAPSHTEGLPWDAPGYQSPLQRVNAPELALALPHDVVELSTGTPTSLHLNGSVAIGIVLVSRDQGSEAMTDPERAKIIQEIQVGLLWLATVEPRARVSFVYDIRPVTVTVGPGPYAGVTDPYERFEGEWRDAALAVMGYAAGRSGYQQYANDLRSSRGADWAYVAFFTKYPLHHFAYAIWEKVVMEYANDGWGPDNIHRVFTHESCHIFGAADEYGSCTCGGMHGQLGGPNNNCVNCFPPGAQVPCLMNANTLTVCNSTRRQIGWDPSLFPKVGGWNGDWFPLPGQAVFDRDKQQIAAVSRAPGNLDLFVIGFDNHVWTTFWNDQVGWNSDWFPLPGQAVFDRDKQQIAAVSRAPGNLDLFVIGFDNHVWTTFWNAAGRLEQRLVPAAWPGGLRPRQAADRGGVAGAGQPRPVRHRLRQSRLDHVLERSGRLERRLVPAARPGGVRPRQAADRRGVAGAGQPRPVRHRLRQSRLDHVLERRRSAGTATGSRCPARRYSTATSSRSPRSRGRRATSTCSSSASTITSGPRSGTIRPAGTATGSRCPARRCSTATSSRSPRSRGRRATSTCSSSASTTMSGPRSGTIRAAGTATGSRSPARPCSTATSSRSPRCRGRRATSTCSSSASTTTSGPRFGTMGAALPGWREPMIASTGSFIASTRPAPFSRIASRVGVSIVSTALMMASAYT